MTPIIITLFAVLGGALVLGWSFRRTGFPLLAGVLIGMAAGLIGPQLSMIPLSYCPFEAEHAYGFTVHLADQAYAINAAALVGVFFIVIGTWAVLLIAGMVYRQVRRTGSFFPPQQQSSRFFKGWNWLPWALLAPTLVSIVLFVYYPAAQTFSLSTQLVRLGIERTAPVCVDNFAQLIAGPRENAQYYFLSNGYIVGSERAEYFSVIAISVFYAVGIVILANGIALTIAYVAYRKFRGAGVYRTLLVWPYALSSVVTGSIFLSILSPRVGLISNLLVSAGLPEIPWLQNATVAPWTIVFAATWNILGFNILFYIAGLQNVPRDLLEAAAVDGASAFQRFRHITIPMLSPIIFFLVFSNLTYAFFDLFGVIDKITPGGLGARPPT